MMCRTEEHPNILIPKVSAASLNKASILTKANWKSDLEVQKLMDLRADLTPIPEFMFKRVAGNGIFGEEYYKLQLFIEMIYQSGSFKFTLIYNGQRLDTVEQVFD
jgi:hypothetical protein